MVLNWAYNSYSSQIEVEKAYAFFIYKAFLPIHEKNTQIRSEPINLHYPHHITFPKALHWYNPQIYLHSNKNEVGSNGTEMQ